MESDDMPDTKETLAAPLHQNPNPTDDQRDLVLTLLFANAETNEEKLELRAEFVAIAKALGLRLAVIQQECEVGALVRSDGSPALWANLDPDGPDGEAFVDLGCPPDPQLVRLINIVIGAPVEAMDEGGGEDRVFRCGPDGAFRFGYGDGVDLYPGDASGLELRGELPLVLSSSSGCWFINGEDAK